MTARPRSRKQEQAQLAAVLRAQGNTWPAVAAEFRRRYRVNARTALRLAHGWSQREAAEQWNARWPDDPKTFKNISSWEVWPSPTGHAPSLETLGRLAQIYKCSTADLITDCSDYSDRDSARQPDALLAQRQVIGEFGKAAPVHLRPRVLSAYSELSQIVGWQLFNLGHYRAAQYYYDDARTDAHEAENVELVTYILCTMSHLATWRNRPRVGIDHAIAAQTWAVQTPSAKARAYSADVAARAFAAARNNDKFQAALEDECTALVIAGKEEMPGSSWWYFHDESFYYGTMGESALQLGSPEDAWRAAQQSLKLIDPANIHNYAHTMAIQAEARIQQGDVAEACQAIGDIAKLTAANRSGRITERIGHLRTALEPWQRTRSVRTLDEQLTCYGVPNGVTHHSI